MIWNQDSFEVKTDLRYEYVFNWNIEHLSSFEKKDVSEHFPGRLIFNTVFNLIKLRQSSKTVFLKSKFPNRKKKNQNRLQ